MLEAAAQLNLWPEVNAPLAAARSLRSKATGVLAMNGPTDEAERAAQRAFELMRLHARDDLQRAEAYGTLARALSVARKQAQAIQAAQRALALYADGGATRECLPGGAAATGTNPGLQRPVRAWPRGCAACSADQR